MALCDEMPLALLPTCALGRATHGDEKRCDGFVVGIYSARTAQKSPWVHLALIPCGFHEVSIAERCSDVEVNAQVEKVWPKWQF